MRCPDCNKFVSYEDEPEVETQGEDLHEGHLNIAVEIGLNCGECGTRLKESSQELDTDTKCPECGGTDLEISNVDANGSSRLETTDAKGKPIKNPRYMKTYYGADLTVNIHCNSCDHDWYEDHRVEEQASCFDEC